MLIALILASGHGTRLAPLSTEERPKQFLNLINEHSLVENTVNRVSSFIPKENIFVIINKKHYKLAKSLLNFPDRNLILEPEMKETLASISHAVSSVSKLYSEKTTFLILPSDHYVGDNKNFEQSILFGLNELNLHNRFVLFGVKPTYPSTEFGYIQTIDKDSYLEITNFIEKPSYDKAESLVKLGNCYWNNGIMLATKELLFNAINEILPEQYSLLKKYDDNLIVSEEYFAKTFKGSISKTVLEHQKGMILVPVDYEWYDVGNFETLFEILDKLNLEEKSNELREKVKVLS